MKKILSLIFPIPNLFKLIKSLFQRNSNLIPVINVPNLQDMYLPNRGNEIVYRNYPSPTSSLYTTSTSSIFPPENIKKIDTKLVFHFVKKWVPFILKIDDITGHDVRFDPYTFTPYYYNRISMTVIVSPTHFAETFSNPELTKKITTKVSKVIYPLLRTMYPDIVKPTGELTIIFNPIKTQTLLDDYLNDKNR